MSRVLHCVVLVLGAATVLPAHAADADADARERARIATERARAEATWREREHECSTRFAVTSCVEDARRDYRAALASLRRQQALLDEAERRQRAAERTESLATKAAQDKTPPAPRAREARAAPPTVDAPAAAPAAASGAADRRAQEAARAAAAFEARTQAAQAHRAAVERRNAEREKPGKLNKPLPDPTRAASAAAP